MRKIFHKILSLYIVKDMNNVMYPNGVNKTQCYTNIGSCLELQNCIDNSLNSKF